MSTKSTNTSVEESQENAENRRKKGEFVRGLSGFRNTIGDDDFPIESGRYHLFVAFNCPWCHRATLARNILGLENSISMDVVFPGRTNEDHPAGANLWEFNPDRVSTLTGEILPECTLETATGNNFKLVKEIYMNEGSTEQSVPILYDKKSKRIVNNESAEIIRILNQNAEKLGSTIIAEERVDLYPENSQLRNEINALNDKIYTAINNGAYKAGFSSDQRIYAAAFQDYFQTLSELETLLASDGRKFLTGNKFTEADLRLFPTLYRHDPVYYLRMKLNGAKILDYPNLWRWLCRVYGLSGVPASNSLVHCRQGYFGRSWNNTIPLGPMKPMSYPEAYNHPDLVK
jgi:putative glutathione S-transferase